jgi:putrescine aminotransferase
MPSIRQLFLNHVAQTSDFPLAIDVQRASGCSIFDTDNKEYIDLISGIGVSSVGHSHPDVVLAVQKQAETYMHVMVYGEFIQSPQVQLATEIVETLPPTLNQVYFVNSGSEATEGALKLAKKFTGRRKIISFQDSYHGSTHGALSVNGSDEYRNGYGPFLPEIDHINFNVLEDLEKITEETACVLIETIQGEAGVQIPSAAYMKALREKCTETGALLILDEVQCGAGRTGKFWAFEHFGIEPDIITSAKGIGGGMPIGMFISRQDIMAVLKNNPVLGHITTFGGHPVSCAGSLAAVQFLKSSGIIETVEEKGRLFEELLFHPRIKSIRRIGLMMAVELENFDRLKKTIDRTIELGIITDWFLYCNDSMRIAPPLIIEEKDIKKACNIILQALDET